MTQSIININLNTPKVLPLSCFYHIYFSEKFNLKALINLSLVKNINYKEPCLINLIKPLCVDPNIFVVLWMTKNKYITDTYNIIDALQKSIIIRRHCVSEATYNLAQKESSYTFIKTLKQEAVNFYNYTLNSTTSFEENIIKFYKQPYEVFSGISEFSNFSFVEHFNPLIYYNQKVIANFFACNCHHNTNNIIIIPYINENILSQNNSKYILNDDLDLIKLE